MEAIEVKATLETRLSKRTGKPYLCILIKLTDTYDKVVFLDNAESELIKVNHY